MNCRNLFLVCMIAGSLLPSCQPPEKSQIKVARKTSAGKSQGKKEISPIQEPAAEKRLPGPKVPQVAKEWRHLEAQSIVVRGRTLRGILSPYGKSIQKANRLADRYVEIIMFSDKNPRHTLAQLFDVGNVSAPLRTAFQEGVESIKNAEGKKDFSQKARRANERFSHILRAKATRGDLPFLIFCLEYLNSPSPEYMLLRGEPLKSTPIQEMINRELKKQPTRDESLGLVLVALDRYNGLTSSEILCIICADAQDIRALPELFNRYSLSYNNRPLIRAILKIDPKREWLNRYIAHVERQYPAYHSIVRSAHRLKQEMSRRR